MRVLKTFENYSNSPKLDDEIVNNALTQFQVLLDFGYSFNKNTAIERLNQILNQIWQNGDEALRHKLETQRQEIISQILNKLSSTENFLDE